MPAGIRTPWFVIVVLVAAAPTAFAHQIHNGSFESGINPPAPPTPPRVAADPGTVDLTESAENEPVPPFLGPLGWSGLVGGPMSSFQSTGLPGGQSRSSIGRNGLRNGPRSGRPGQSGGGGGAGGGSGSGGGGPGRSGSQPTPGTAILNQSEESLYPNQDSTLPTLANSTDDMEDEGTILEKDPVWVAQLFKPSPTGSLQSQPSEDPGDAISSDNDGPIHSNPAPAGVWLGLMALGTVALRYRRNSL